MIFTVIKNSILAILIILILHIILKNELLEGIEKVKNKEIVSDSKIITKPLKNKEIIEKQIKPANDSEVYIPIDIQESIKKKVKKSKNNELHDAYDDKECSNSITCSDFNLPDNVINKEQIDELYEYVYNTSESDKELDLVFSENRQNIKVDMTELDKHLKEVSDTQKQLQTSDQTLCGFEIVGVIDNDEEICGLDIFSQNQPFSKVI